MTTNKRLFFQNPGNKAFAETGDVRKFSRFRQARDRYRASACISAILVICLLSLLAHAIDYWDNVNQLPLYGLTTSAHIVSHSADDDPAGYFISYSFVADSPEQTYTRQQAVSSGLYQELEVGRNADVIYLPSDPNFSELRGTKATSFDYGGLGYISFFEELEYVTAAALVTVITLIGATVLYRRRRRMQHGIFVGGHVTDSKKVMDSEGDTYFTFEYTFTAPRTGKSITKQAFAWLYNAKGKSLPAPGTPVLVFCWGPNGHSLL